MSKNIVIISFCFLLFCACNSNQVITLENELDIHRIDEPVVISRQKFENYFGIGDSLKIPFLKTNYGFLPMQLDDLDGDQEWDELAFLVNIEANTDLEIQVEWLAKSQAPKFKNRTQVYLGEKQADGRYQEVLHATAPTGLDGFPSAYQAEGVGWENDKIAFRIYFDCRNTKDLFGKLTPELILHKAGTPEMGNYHKLSSWGMDILHCGSSLGAGGLAMLEEDSLYRLGSTDSYKYIEISQGPVRSIFELRYDGWKVANEKLQATERITLWAGKYWFRSEVVVSEFKGVKQLVSGIVTSKLETEPIKIDANSSYSAIITHGEQSLNNDKLAMAVLVPKKEVVNTGHSGNTNYYELGHKTVPSKKFSHPISETYYISQQIKNNTPVSHYFFAMWELEDPVWVNSQSVIKLICTEADKLSSPIKVKF